MADAHQTKRRELFYRQSAWTRVTHWIWAVTLFFMVTSGLQIFNAHPILYFGRQSGFGDKQYLGPQAGYGNFRCYDPMEDTPSGPALYYESVDLISARHPQTILAYGLNGQTLPIANGAPLRVRIEQQLGYKMAKYIRAIELVDSFAEIAGGNGGYWEDRGYDWYAGS